MITIYQFGREELFKKGAQFTGTMQDHKGTVKLRYLSREKELIGSYYNSIGNTGNITLEFEQLELKKKF